MVKSLKTVSTVKRIKATNEEYESAALSAALDAPLKNTADLALFTLDTDGAAPSKRSLKRKAQTSLSASGALSLAFSSAPSVASQKVDRLVAAHSASTLSSLSASRAASANLGVHKRGRIGNSGVGSVNFALSGDHDIWGSGAQPLADMLGGANRLPKDKSNMTRHHRQDPNVVSRAGVAPVLLGHGKIPAPKKLLPPGGVAALYGRHSGPSSLAAKVVKGRQASGVVKVQLPHPGASFNPEHAQHQDLLGTAVALELVRREGEIEYATPGIKDGGKGLSEEVRGMLVGDDDEDEEDDDDDDDDDDDGTLTLVEKKKRKKTQAERNRAKRHAALLHTRNMSKLSKKKSADLLLVKKTARDLQKKEEALALDRSELRLLKKERDSRPLGSLPLGAGTSAGLVGGAVDSRRTNFKVLAKVPAVSVALTTDLRATATANIGSIRTMVGKGGLLGERVLNLQDRGVLNPKSLREFKKKEGKKRKKMGRGGAGGIDLL